MPLKLKIITPLTCLDEPRCPVTQIPCPVPGAKPHKLAPLKPLQAWKSGDSWFRGFAELVHDEMQIHTSVLACCIYLHIIIASVQACANTYVHENRPYANVFMNVRGWPKHVRHKKESQLRPVCPQVIAEAFQLQLAS